MCRVGRRCFPHSAEQLDRAEAEERRLQLVYDSRVSYAEKHSVSQAWVDQAAEELALARQRLRKRQVEFASTARGAQNLLLEAQALDECGQPEQAVELRRLVTRGMAKRRAADIAENPGCADQWTPPQVRGSGDRCPACGQFTGVAHRCPPVILEVNRRVRAVGGTLPLARPGATELGSASAGAVSAQMYRDVPISAADAEAIAAVCTDDRYGPVAGGLPDLPRRADGTIDTVCAEFATYRDTALARAQEMCFEDEYIDGEPMPVVLSQGAMEPFAVAAKRNAAAKLGAELAGVDDRELFDDKECAALANPEQAQWGVSGHGLCWRTADDQPWREIGTGEKVSVSATTVDPSALPLLARRSIASQAMAGWAAHTERNPVSVGLHAQAAVQDLFVHPNTDPPQAVEARRARAVMRAQYDLTQRHLAEHGISEVSVSRGMWFSTDGPVPSWVPAAKGERHRAHLTLNPATSFTTRSEVSSYFARREWDDDEYVSVRVHGTVPASRILSLPSTGLGCLAEEEIVVIGGHGQWEAERV